MCSEAPLPAAWAYRATASAALGAVAGGIALSLDIGDCLRRRGTKALGGALAVSCGAGAAVVSTVAATVAAGAGARAGAAASEEGCMAPKECMVWLGVAPAAIARFDMRCCNVDLRWSLRSDSTAILSASQLPTTTTNCFARVKAAQQRQVSASSLPTAFGRHGYLCYRDVPINSLRRSLASLSKSIFNTHLRQQANKHSSDRTSNDDRVTDT